MQNLESNVMRQPMRALTSQKSEEWYTPKEIIERVRTVLGDITLDPASDAIPQAWIRAEHYFTQADDGLSKPWFGNVFLNPPYCGNAAKWAAKMIDEYRSGRVASAIMLINSQHGYKWYEDLWATFPVCCLRNRLRFIKPNGETGGQSKQAQTLVYLGQDVEGFAGEFADIGRILLPVGAITEVKTAIALRCDFCGDTDLELDEVRVTEEKGIICDRCFFHIGSPELSQADIDAMKPEWEAMRKIQFPF
jgi:hypothetical protein